MESGDCRSDSRGMSRLLWWIAATEEGSLYVLLFLLPFSKAAIEVTSVIWIVAWVIERLHPRGRANTVWLRKELRTVAFWLVAYLGACAVSTIVSDYPALSLKGFVGKWLQYLFLFVVAADLGSRVRVIDRTLRVIAASACFVLVEAVTQELLGRGIFRGFPRNIFGRMTGPYENPIDLATYLMVISLILLTFALTQRRGKRLALAVLLGSLFLCLARTTAVGAWLGFGIGLAVVIIGYSGIRRYAPMFLGTLVLIGGFFLHRVGRLGRFFSLSDVGRVDRWAMWQAAIGMIRDRPLFGHGVNTFMANYLKYWVGGERQPRYAHSCYLQVAAETGVVGLVAFVGLLGAIGVQLCRGLQELTKEARLLLLGFSAGLLAFVVQSGVDTNFYALRQVALFWVLAGLAVGLSIKPTERSATGSKTAGKPQAIPMTANVPLAELAARDYA